MVRVARPTSRGWPLAPMTTGTTAASQASIRNAPGVRVPPKSSSADRQRFSRSSNRTSTLDAAGGRRTSGRSPW